MGTISNVHVVTRTTESKRVIRPTRQEVPHGLFEPRSRNVTASTVVKLSSIAESLHESVVPCCFYKSWSDIYILFHPVREVCLLGGIYCSCFFSCRWKVTIQAMSSRYFLFFTSAYAGTVSSETCVETWKMSLGMF